MRYIAIILALLYLLHSCGKPIYRLINSDSTPTIEHTVHKEPAYQQVVKESDSLTLEGQKILTPFGDSLYFAQGVRDSATNQIIPLKELNEIYISADREGVVERDGKVSINFNIEIPKQILSKGWQTEVTPIVKSSDTTLILTPALLSGELFKKEQERGYQRYKQFLSTLLPEGDSPLKHFTNLKELSIFLERYLPSSKLLSGEFSSEETTLFGLNERAILEHYINYRLVEKNRVRHSQKEAIFKKYINRALQHKTHIDTLIEGTEERVTLNYAYTLDAAPLTNRFKVSVKGLVFNKSGLSVELKESSPIEFRVSSINGLTQDIVRYKQVTVRKREQLIHTSNIEFPLGGTQIDTLFSNNQREFNTLLTLLDSLESVALFDIDTIYITASASPEGRYKSNLQLSNRRAINIKEYLQLADVNAKEIISDPKGEDWEQLLTLIISDPIIEQKERIASLYQVADLDKREQLLKREPSFNYIEHELYPRLRKVTFTIKLCRRDLVEEQIVTTEVDKLYSSGVEALKNKRYSEAILLLTPYKDINSAVAHLAIGEDQQASKILKQLPESGISCYMLALIAARKGDEKLAITLFTRSKELEPKMAYRGSLDPELSVLIERYGLNSHLFN